MKKEITLEMAQDIGIIPKPYFYKKIGKFFFWDIIDEISEEEYRRKVRTIKKNYNVTKEDTVFIEVLEIEKKLAEVEDAV